MTKKKITVQLHEKLIKGIDTRATEKGISRDAMLSILLYKMIENVSLEEANNQFWRCQRQKWANSKEKNPNNKKGSYKLSEMTFNFSIYNQKEKLKKTSIQIDPILVKYSNEPEGMIKTQLGFFVIDLFDEILESISIRYI